MEIYENHINKTDDLYDYKRYIGFWPYLLISCFILLTSSYLYLRYANYIYESKSKIEIIDKSQDDDMALPTAMTIFNRSMINLENEIGVLNSFSIHNKVVKKLNSNIKFLIIKIYLLLSYFNVLPEFNNTSND